MSIETQLGNGVPDLAATQDRTTLPEETWAAALRQQAAHGLKWRAIEMVGRQCLSLAVFTMLARLLKPADFGLIAIVATYLAFINILVDQGIGTALVQRPHLQPEHLDAAFWFNLACAVAMCAATIASADVLARVAGDARVAPLLRWASAALVINATVTVQSSMLMREIEFRHLTLRVLLGNAVGGVLGVAMAWKGYGVWSLIWQQLVGYLIGAWCLWVVTPWRPSFRFSPRHLAELMKVSASVFATSVLWVFSSRIDQLVIGRFAGAAVLGEYAVGVRLSDLARNTIQEPVSTISMPALAKVQDDYARLRTALYKAMELNAVIAFAVFGGLASIAPSLVPLAFGAQWRDAGTILQLVSVYSLAIVLSLLFHPALLASGGPGRYVLINVVCAIGSATACLVGIRFGVHTLVLLLILNMLVTSALGLVFLRHRMGLSAWQFCRPCVVPAAAASVMFLVVTVIRHALATSVQLWLLTSIEIVAGAVVYCSIVWLLASDTFARAGQLAAAMWARPRQSALPSQ